MKLFFLAGLPRSGSTLLSAILNQNPQIHAEGNSAVCQLMWDMQQSCEQNAQEQLRANRRLDTQDALVRAIPNVYYRNVQAEFVVDKCRVWTNTANMQMIKRYITPKPKVIVLSRPVSDVIDSFARLRRDNGWTGDVVSDLTLNEGSPLVIAIRALNDARTQNDGEFLFLEYDDLVTNTVTILDRIYDFCGWDAYEHDLNNIVSGFPEDDSVYGLMGMHDVRPTIGYRSY